MQMKPFEDRVLVEPEEVEESRSKGGIIIPDTAKGKLRTGKVIEVGPDEEPDEKIKVGGRIVFAKFTGDAVEFEDKNFDSFQKRYTRCNQIGLLRKEHKGA